MPCPNSNVDYTITVIKVVVMGVERAEGVLRNIVK